MFTKVTHQNIGRAICRVHNKKADTARKGYTMKKLINESSIYITNITTAITKCYADRQPSNSELMHLYATIGEQITKQGETAFVAHLAEIIKTAFPSLSGYSLRNLRRMRDFYLAYKDEPTMLAMALGLSWTQNTVIMEYCETKKQRAFYIQLTLEQNLSKLKLIEAIESKTYETAQISEKATEAVFPVVTPVSDFIDQEACGTCTALKTKREPFVKPCDEVVQILWVPSVINTIFHKLE